MYAPEVDTAVRRESRFVTYPSRDFPILRQGKQNWTIPHIVTMGKYPVERFGSGFTSNLDVLS